MKVARMVLSPLVLYLSLLSQNVMKFNTNIRSTGRAGVVADRRSDTNTLAFNHLLTFESLKTKKEV